MRQKREYFDNECVFRNLSLQKFICSCSKHLIGIQAIRVTLTTDMLLKVCALEQSYVHVQCKWFEYNQKGLFGQHKDVFDFSAIEKS